MDLFNKINDLGLELPKPPKPAGVYRPILIVDKYLFVSGQGPLKIDGKLIKGKVGQDLDREKGKLAARQVGLTMLSSIVSNLDPKIKIKRVIKVLGMVNATPDFKDHPYVTTMVKEGMDEFVKTHVCCYPESKNVKAHFIGSISKIYEKELNYAANKNGIILGNIIRKPVENLVDYHLRQLQLI